MIPKSGQWHRKCCFVSIISILFKKAVRLYIQVLRNYHFVIILFSPLLLSIIVIPRFTSLLVPKKGDVNRNVVNWILCSTFLTRSLKIWSYSHPSISVAVGTKTGDVNWMTTQIEVRGNKKFGDINRKNVNRGDVNRRIKKSSRLHVGVALDI